jgi:Tfp pilus assembly protein PilF
MPPEILIADPPPTMGGVVPGAGQRDFDRAVTYLKRGAYQQALPELQRALQSQPANAQAWYYHGLCLDQLGQRAQAAQSYERAIGLDATLVEPRINLAAVYLEPPLQVARAVELLLVALKHQPKAADIHENLGYAYGLNKDYPRSGEHYRQALALRPNARISLAYGDTLYASRKFSEAAKQYKIAFPAIKGQLDVVYRLARRFAKAKAYADCVTAFDVLLAKKSMPPLHVQRGVCRHGLTDEAGARADYKAALALDATYQAAYYYLALSYLSDGRREEAAEALESAMKLGTRTAIGKKARQRYDVMTERLKRRKR